MRPPDFITRSKTRRNACSPAVAVISDVSREEIEYSKLRNWIIRNNEARPAGQNDFLRFCPPCRGRSSRRTIRLPYSLTTPSALQSDSLPAFLTQTFDLFNPWS